MPGLTFGVFNEIWRDVVVRTFGEDASLSDEESAMLDFVNIWLCKSTYIALYRIITDSLLLFIRR